MVRQLMAGLDADAVLLHETDGRQLLEVKAGKFVSDDILAQINSRGHLRE